MGQLLQPLGWAPTDGCPYSGNEIIVIFRRVVALGDGFSGSLRLGTAQLMSVAQQVH